MDDTHIRSINDLSLKLEKLDPEQVKTIRQRRHELNSRPVPEWEAVGPGERGLEGHLTSAFHPLCQMEEFPWQPTLVPAAA